jgi:hypothetical protein
MADTIKSGARAPGLAAPELAALPAADLPSLGAAGAAAAGLTADHKDEAPGRAWREGFRDQGTEDRLDCQTVAATEQADAKRFAGLRARLALAGWALSRTSAADGPVVLFATQWNMPRELASLDAVAEFADRVGAPQ